MPDKLTEQYRLVRRINELFHDLDAQQYSNIHPEIFSKETVRWQQVFGKFLPHHTSRTIVDVGCGTGFLGMIAKKYLSTDDTLICLDISEGMLQQCRQNLSGYPAQTDFRKINQQIELPPESADCICMNSVLHHIPDWKAEVQTLVGALRPGGILCIGHEPNNRFVQSVFLNNQQNWLQKLRPKAMIAAVLKTLGLYHAVVAQTNDSQLQAVNDALLSEDLIEKPLTAGELSSLIDIHSPSAGGRHPDRGFDCENCLSDWADDLDVVFLETYNHLGKMSYRYQLLRPYEKLLETILPKKGATFFVVARKK